MPPARQAMRLVQHPGADLALVQHPAHRAGAKLLGRDEQDARFAQPYPVQRIGPLGHRQQPVDGHAAADPVRLQPRHLVRHERDQRRDHHRQRPHLVVARERRDLVAERLAGAGGKNPQHVPPRHRRLDDGLLQGMSAVVRRLGTKSIETEPAFKLLAGVVPFPAPAADGIGTGRVPQTANQPPGFRELMTHPGRHHRVAAGHRQPCQRIGKRPAAFLRPRQYLSAVRRAGRTFKAAADRRQSFSSGRTGRLADLPEELVKSAVHAPGVRRAQPVPGYEQIRRSLLSGLAAGRQKSPASAVHPAPDR